MAGAGWRIERQLLGHGWSSGLACAYSPDGAMVVVADGARRVAIIEAGGRKPAYEFIHTSEIRHAAWASDGNVALTCAGAEVVVVTRDAAWSHRVVYKHPVFIFGCAFSACGRVLAVAGGDRRIVLLDAQSAFSVTHRVDSSYGWVLRVALSPDGRWLFSTSGASSVVEVHAMDSLAPVTSLAHHTQPVLDLALSPGGLSVLACSTDGTASLWRTPAADSRCWPTAPALLLAAHDGWVTSGAFVDESLAVTGARDHTVRVWSTRDGAALHVIRTAGDVMSLCAHASGRLTVGLGRVGGFQEFRETLRARVACGRAASPKAALQLADLDRALAHGVCALSSAQLALWLEDVDALLCADALGDADGAALRHLTAKDIVSAGGDFDAACRLLLATYRAEYGLAEAPAGLLAWDAAQVQQWLPQRLSGAALASIDLAACIAMGASPQAAAALVERVKRQKEADVACGTAPQWSAAWSAAAPLVALPPPH